MICNWFSIITRCCFVSRGFTSFFFYSEVGSSVLKRRDEEKKKAIYWRFPCLSKKKNAVCDCRRSWIFLFVKQTKPQVWYESSRRESVFFARLNGNKKVADPDKKDFDLVFVDVSPVHRFGLHYHSVTQLT